MFMQFKTMKHDVIYFNKINNKIYFYKMLIINFLQAMLVKRAK
jgi:hypothetical protein